MCRDDEKRRCACRELGRLPLPVLHGERELTESAAMQSVCNYIRMSAALMIGDTSGDQERATSQRAHGVLAFAHPAKRSQRCPEDGFNAGCRLSARVLIGAENFSKLLMKKYADSTRSVP